MATSDFVYPLELQRLALQDVLNIDFRNQNAM